MSRRLIIHPDASEDLAAAHDWYEAKQPGLDAEMSISFRRVCFSRRNCSEAEGH